MAAVAETARSLDPQGPGLEWGMQRIRRANEAHDSRCRRYAQREQAWYALRSKQEEEATLNKAPLVRFAYQRIDTLVHYITSQKPVGRVKPKLPGDKCESAARLLDKGLNEWRRRDGWDMKEVEVVTKACIYGVCPVKNVWDYQRTEETQTKVIQKLMRAPQIQTSKVWVTKRDQPSMVPIDPFDFMWDPSCTSLDDAEYVVHFTYVTIEQLRQGQKEGRYSNVDELSPIGDQTSNEFQRPGRQRDLRNRIEIAEVWDRGRFVAIANRKTLIRDEDNIYNHGELPFTIIQTMPNLSNLDGPSEIEIIAAIQREMHAFRQELMLNAHLANKLIVLLEGDTRDADKFVNALRGDDPVNVLPVETQGEMPATWNPAASLVQMGEQMMDFLKQEMDDISGVGPYVSGAAEQGVDPKTATEVQALQSASMRRITGKRNMVNMGLQRCSNLDLANVSQFMRTPLAIRVDKGDGWNWEAVDPQDVVDADLEYEYDNADETLDQQQKRTESSIRLQMALQVAQVIATLPPGSQPAMPNLSKEYEDFLRDYGVLDPASYMTAVPLPPPPPPIAPPGPPGAPPPGGGDTSGAAAGPVTPPSGPAPGGTLPPSY